MNGRAKFCVDWDGTCVEEIWPEMGGWLPGAVEGLRYLLQHGRVCIYSVRCQEYEYDGHTIRPDGAAISEAVKIRDMLDAAGLEDVEIYPNNRGKPPAQYYIDDRAVEFKGSWFDTLKEINRREFRVQ